MNEEEMNKVLGTLRMGCPLETAAHFAGVEIEDVEAEMMENPAFQREVLLAQATPEIVHMQGVREAAKEVKNWRANVWWLERCLPQKYGRRPPRTVPVEDFEKFITELIGLVDSEVCDRRDKQRLISKIHGMQSRQKVIEIDGELATDESSE